MKDVTPSLPQPSHDEIATCAYFLWEHAGSPEGSELDFWKQAEECLGSRFGADEPAWKDIPKPFKGPH